MAMISDSRTPGASTKPGTMHSLVSTGVNDRRRGRSLKFVSSNRLSGACSLVSAYSEDFKVWTPRSRMSTLSPKPSPISLS